MSWTWQLEKEDGTVLVSRGLPKETFSSQGDAESWIGENWQGLLEAGGDQVTLLEEGRAEYGPISRHPAQEDGPGRRRAFRDGAGGAPARPGRARSAGRAV